MFWIIVGLVVLCVIFVARTGDTDSSDGQANAVRNETAQATSSRASAQARSKGASNRYNLPPSH